MLPFDEYDKALFAIGITLLLLSCIPIGIIVAIAVYILYNA
jgi:hypothetical protein